MGEAFIIRRGGTSDGGGSLNLTVIGGTSRPGGGDTLTWDGNTDGKATLEHPEILGCFVKISDAIPALSDCKNGMIVQTTDGAETTYSAEEIDGLYNAIGVVGNQLGTYVIPSDGFVLMGAFTFPESGVWVAYAENAPYVTSITIPGYTGFGSGSVKDNTVWIDTTTPINGYAFSAEEPASPAEGMVWFQTGLDASAPINLDRKNTVMLYPVDCMQYISGAWVYKTAQTYIGGEWLTWWQGELYVGGDTFNSTTGGFVSVKFAGTAPKVTYNANNVKLVQANQTWDGLWRTKNLIDLSGFSKLSWTYSGWWIQDSENDLRLVVLPQNATDISGVAAYLQRKSPSDGGTYTVTLDVSKLTGKYYIGIYMYVRYGDQTVYVHDLHLEK